MIERSKRKMLLIFGSNIKLAFFDYLFKDEFKKNNRVNIVNFDHHKSLYSSSYLRYVFNSIHLLKIIYIALSNLLSINPQLKSV